MCNSPSKAWLPKQPDQYGKRNLNFKEPNNDQKDTFDNIDVPCGKCIACQKLKATKDAVQLYCEKRTTDKPCWFITLTYDDEHLPDDFSVHKEPLQKFIRSLRDEQRKDNGKATLRYRARGEYGGQFARPHYHVAAFALEIDDLEIYTVKNLDQPDQYYIYKSESISEKWEYGSVAINELTIQNCIYIATHHLDEKILQSTESYVKPVIHPRTKKLILVQKPEFDLVSTKPALGKKFYDKYFGDIFPHDFVLIKGNKLPVPRYFNELLKKDDPAMYQQVTQKRLEKLIEETQLRKLQKEEYKKAVMIRNKKPELLHYSELQITGNESLSDLMDNPETTQEAFEQWEKMQNKDKQNT